jgi:transcriptional regulator with XRE-family HTH domain
MTRGRPSDYDKTRHPGWAKSLARRGLTQEQIAAEMGISCTTLKEWKKHREFLTALKEGKSEADNKVEASLFQRAVGYSYKEVKHVDSEKDGKRVERMTKFVPPDVTAQIFWLKNRRPDLWRDVKQQEITGKGGGPIDVHGMSDEELEKRARDVLARRSNSG